MQDSEPSRKGRWNIVPVIAAAVAGGIVLAVWLLDPPFAPADSHAQDVKNATFCRSNLKSLGTAIELYRMRFKCYPETRSGIQFLLAPLKEGLLGARMSLESAVRNMCVCPGDEMANQRLIDGKRTYRDLNNVNPMFISYAGRNTLDYPLDRWKAKHEAIACDAGGAAGDCLSHHGVIQVVFLDLHVETIRLSDYPGVDEADFKVGPDSPIPVLRTLNKNP